MLSRLAVSGEFSSHGTELKEIKLRVKEIKLSLEKQAMDTHRVLERRAA